MALIPRLDRFYLDSYGVYLCHSNVISSNIFKRGTRTSLTIAVVVRIDHVPEVVNIGPRRVDNLCFQPQIDTDLWLFMHDMRVTTFESTMKPFPF